MGVAMKLRWGLRSLFLPFLCCVCASPALAVGTDRITGGNGDSGNAVISADGAYVAFESDATNLVPGDTNGKRDVFLWERSSRQFTRISVANDGTQSDGFSSSPSISADGRLVAFVSRATDLLPVTPTGCANTFLYDRETDQLSLAVVGVGGASPNGDTGGSISANGRYVYFGSSATNLGVDNPSGGIFARDLLTGHIARVDTTVDGLPPDTFIWGPTSISPDGRYVTLVSKASNLVSGDTNGINDTFVHDLLTGQTERVSVASDGSQAIGDDLSSGGAVVSGDGRFVAFTSSGTNLVPGLTQPTNTFVRDRQTPATELVSYDPLGAPYAVFTEPIAMSADGRLVAFRKEVPGPYGSAYLACIRDRQAQETVESQGYPLHSGGSMSANGRYLAISASSAGPDYRDIYVWEPGILSFGVIAGTVTDAKTGLPVPGAGIWIGGSLYTAAGSDGSFSIEVAEATSTTVRAEAGGYAPTTQSNVAVTAGNTTSVNLAISSLVPLVADFSAAPLSGVAPLTVAFADASVGNPSPTSWSWEFGDGGSSTEQNPTHVYQKAGKYTVSLTASSATDSDTNTKEGYVTATFADMPAGSWGQDEILACVNAGIVQGVNGSYFPTNPVTRDQLAVYIARAMNGADLTGTATVPFVDVTNPWANVYIAYCIDHGVVKGFDATHYGPTQEVDRASMAVFVARAKGWVSINDAMNTAPELFADVPAGYWSGTAIQACVDHGVVNGYDATHYQPTWIVTRDQMAVFVQRAFQLPM